MKYMLLMNYAAAPGAPPMTEWAPEDVQAHADGMMAIHAELAERGELVDTQALTGAQAAKIVRHDGIGAPVITDGPFPESREFLAGYWLVDVESEERAIEIAARTSACPGHQGAAINREIEVRPVMSRPPDMDL